MTPRRRLRCALTVVTGGVAAVALVGCSNGVHVAGPTEPHESVISGAASPSAGPSSAKPKSSPKSTRSPSAKDSASSDTDTNTGGRNGGTGGNDSSGGQRDGGGKTNGQHRTGGPKSGKHSDDQGIGSPRSTSKPKGSGGSGQDTSGTGSGSGSSGTDQSGDKSGEDAGTVPKGRTCELGDLTVGARVPAGSGAAGSQYVLITFTNKSGAPCWMYGYAGVSFVGNQDGTQLGKPARRAKSVSASPVKLADGNTETELLKIADAGVWDAKECVPTTSDGFRIYPPSSYTAAYVKFATTACQSKSVRQLTVFPVGTKS